MTIKRKHLDKTNSATLRRYHLMGSAVIFRRLYRLIAIGMRAGLYAIERGETEGDGASLLKALIASYTQSDREIRRWEALLRSGYEKGLRSAFDSDASNRKIFSVLLSGTLNPYKTGKRDQFVKDAVRGGSDEVSDSKGGSDTLLSLTLERLNDLSRLLTEAVLSSLRESNRLGLSPAEGEKRIGLVLTSTLEDVRSLIYDEITRAFDHGVRHGREALRGN